jgi:polysaccharide deacetylase 2 family uncharacterized protein YibQ
MQRRKLIRGRRKRATGRGSRLRGFELVFWLLLILAVLVGGEQALKGHPQLAATFVPPGLMATQANETAPQASAFMRLTASDSPSLSPPQVIKPLQAHAPPGWLHRQSAEPQQVAAVAFHATPASPSIAIVIDDLGNDVAAARRAIALPKQVTLSFLPYPDATAGLARDAARAGHEILVHVPMEPEGDEDAGPMALEIGLSSGEITRRLDWALSRVPGFSGINNHMGSRFTADRDALIPVMQAVAARHVFFLDSRTTPQSQIVSVARAFGVPTASRDIFLDDENTHVSVADELRLAEARAKEQGVAIAIGHPHPQTLSALETWVRAAASRRIALISVGDVIRLKDSHAALRTTISR